MSQIASAYHVSSELTSRLQTLADHEEYDELLQTLRAQATAVTPEYPYSGYVLGVLSEYLSEQGIALPINPDWLGEGVLEEAEVAWLLCVDTRQASALLDQLSKLQSSDDEMRRYFEAFNQEDAPDAGAMMTAGIVYLRNGLQQMQTQGQWLVVIG
jgi:hypothetical protein